MTHGATRPAARHRKGGADTPTTAVLLLAVVGVLCVVGLVMVLSASSVQALREQGSSWLFFRRQLLWVLAGSLALVAASRLDYHAWGRLAAPLLGSVVALLVLVAIPGVGISVSGSTRWLALGGWRMQPSELAKLGLLVFVAHLLARRSGRGAEGQVPVRPVLIAFGVVAVLVLAQPDMGTTLVLGCIVMVLLHVSGTPMRVMSALLVTAVSAAWLIGMAEPYRRARMLSFLNPWADASNTGYQMVQSLVGLGTGRLTGVGVGASRSKWGFLPNAHTDFIFTIIGEELGLIGSLLVVVLFVAFIVLAMRAALRAPDRFGMLLAAGVAGWVGGQAFMNMGAVTGVVPVTGVPLPFVSFGGSSLVILMGAVGMLLNVARQGQLARAASNRPPRHGARAGTGLRGQASPS